MKGLQAPAGNLGSLQEGFSNPGLSVLPGYARLLLNHSGLRYKHSSLASLLNPINPYSSLASLLRV